MRAETSSSIRMVGALWVASAIAALDFDPWLLHPATMLLTLPSRRSLFLLAVITTTLGIATLLMPGLLKTGRRRVFVYIGGGAATYLMVFLATPFVRPAVHLLMVLLALCSTLLLIFIWLRLRAEGAMAGTVANIGTTAVTCLVILLVGEGIFTLTPRSHAVGYTLAARLWYERYWQQSNALGYRDREHIDTSGTKIFVLGDSFVSGLGIPDLSMRLSDLLQKRLGPARRVYNLGWNGADTREEYRRLVAHPLKPDVLILVYYLNDIEGAANAAGRQAPHFQPYSNVPERVARIIRHSYLLDFGYWQVPQRDLAGYQDTLESMYRDPSILALHLADLQRLVDYCHDKRIDLVVVAYPHLARPSETAPLLRPIVESLQAANVPVIEVAPLIAGRDPRLFYVNQNDAHPNERMNAILTDAVVNALSKRLP